MRYLGLVFVSVFLVCSLASPAFPATIAAEYSQDTFTTIFSTGFTHGWEFTALTDLTVEGLAVWDQGSNGLAAAHIVKLWTNGGVLLASATFSPGDTANLSDFVVASITPVPLTSGTTYVISTHMSGVSERFGHNALSGPMIIDPAISVNTTVRRGTPGDNFPVSTFGDYGAPMGASFTISAIPEPGSLALTGLGALALGLCALRRSRRARS